MTPFDFEIIDSHCHLWELDLAKDRWIGPEWTGMYRTFRPRDVEEEGKRWGVTGAIAIECGTSAEENEALRRAAAESNYILGYGPCIDLEAPDLDRQLGYWKADPKCVSVRMRFEGHPDPEILRRPSILEGLRRVADHGLVFDYLVRTHHLPDLVRIHEKIPHLRGVIEHMAKPDYPASADRREWEAGMDAVAKNTDVRCKLSLSPRGEQVAGLITGPKPGWSPEAIRPYARFVLEHFGSERLMWGSDYPISLLTSDYADTFRVLREAVGELPGNAARAVFRDNALKFYGVGSSPEKSADE